MSVLTDPATYDIHPDDAWKRLKLRVRKPIELAVLKEVAAWREREARQRDQPRSRILKDDAVYEIAQQQPKDEAALSRLRTVSKGFERSNAGREILAAVARALAIPKNELPPIPRPPIQPEGTASAVEFLRVLLKIVVDERGVAGRLIASGDDLEKAGGQGCRGGRAGAGGLAARVVRQPGARTPGWPVGPLVYRNRRVEVVKLSDA